jgi:acyl carrier protein
MSVEEGLHVLDSILISKPAQVGAGLIRWSSVLARYGLESAIGDGLASPAVTADPVLTPKDEGELLGELERATETQRTAILFEHVLQLALRVLGFSPGRRVDPQQPLNELGLDSLMAIEFRNLLASEVGQNLPSTLLFNYPTIEDVVGYVRGLLFQDAKQAQQPVQRCANDPLEFVEELSDEDVDRMLAQKLGVPNG